MKNPGALERIAVSVPRGFSFKVACEAQREGLTHEQMISTLIQEALELRAVGPRRRKAAL